MKALRYLIFGSLTMTAFIGRAQNLLVTNAGWFPIGYYDVLTTNNPPESGGTIQPEGDTQQTTPSIAEIITPEIQALADGLQDDPLKIFNYVHDHIRYSLYFGSKKGAELTLLEKSGNDFDQCALLVALLRAAGYTNAGYQFGWMPIPFDSSDGSHRDLHHWLQLNFTNNNWSATSDYLNNLFIFWRSYPNNTGNFSSNFGNNTFAFQRVWVTLTIGSTTNYLDPAFKVSEPIAGIDLANAMYYPYVAIKGLGWFGTPLYCITNTLIYAAAGTVFGDPTTNFYVINLDEASLRYVLDEYTANLLNYIQSHYPNASVEQILGGQYIVPSTNTSLSQCFPFQPTNIGAMSVVSWINEPTNMMSTLKINFGGGSQTYQWFMPQLHGDRIALVYGSSTVQLWQEDLVTNLASGTFSSYDDATITINHPRGSWDVTNNVFIQGWYTLSGPERYFPNSSYAISYVFDPDWGWLQARQKKLEGYRAQGLANTDRAVVTETLNVMALTWQLEVGDLSTAIGMQAGVLPMFHQRIGRMAQEAGHGYYVDVAYMTTGSPSSKGNTCGNYNCDPDEGEWFDQFAYFGSAMEHGMIEQLQSSNLVAGSTVKIIELANTNHQAIYIANSNNWSAVQNQLTNYSLSTLAANYINQGYTLLLPQNGQTQMSAGTNGWLGFGFMARLPNNGGTYMWVGPGLDGGYAGNLNATIDPTFINYYGYSQPSFYSLAPPSLPSFTAADPVDMADGTFQVEATDLSLGQTEPRGLSFSRYYNSSRRNSNLAGIAPGWVHNYYINAANISSPAAGLGRTTPAQAAAMLTATAAAISFYNHGQLDPKNWTVTALIAKWAIDQLTAKAVSVSLGKDVIQFIQAPDGSYTPPANCTMTLLQTNSAYWLQERHGRTFKFNNSGWATNIEDQYGQSLTLAYNPSNWVTTVTDSTKNRTLTFNYSTTSPIRLISVADSTGRSILLGYSSSNDLVSVTDPESKTSTYGYDANHQITATSNALNQLVVSNLYDGFGHVTTQYTQGDTNKTWKIFWSGWQTVSQDPAGGQQSYFYDDKTRLIRQQDALGNSSQKFYDGQDHVVMTVSPLNETNQFVYDGNNNLTQTIDPLGFTNLFIYDGQNNLVKTIDPRGNPSTFGYNAQFSLTGSTNGAGDWVNYNFNADGTLHTRTDFGGMTTYGYDSTYGQLNSITYPNSLGVENFVTSPQGDVTSHTDGKGNVTTFSYNNRRQLTNSIAPTNVVAKLAYDAVGNQLSATDARGNTATNVWSATRKLLAVKLPATPQGVPVITNVYDNRDWLTQTLDPLQKPTQFSDDKAGHLIAVTDSLSQTGNFGYDADGHCMAATNAAQEVTRQTWDARGKLIQLTDGAQHTSSRAYDAAGNQIILTNRNGKKWQFLFDGANRLTSTITPLGRSNTVVFNHQGLPATLTDPAGQPTTLNYDAKGRLSSRADNVGATIYNCDANDNLTNVTETINSQPSTLNYSYDAYNHVSTFTNAAGYVIQYRYDANGNVTNLIYPGGRTVTYFYDSLNRLTNVTDWAQRKTTITYDLASQVTSITRPNGSYRTMNYDSAGQLTNIWEQMANSLPIAWFRLNWTNSGNMAWEFAAPLPHTNAPPTRNMIYDDDNRLLAVNGNSVVNDLDGNLTSGPLTNGTFATYAYDARNRLLSAGGLSYGYDAMNNRIAVTNGAKVARFVINPNSKLPQALMRIRNGATNYYVYGVGLLYEVTETATSTNTLTYHFDYRGSTVALSDGNGNVTDRIEYSAYGLTTYRAGTNDTPFLFNGRYGVQTDPNGLLCMQARYYNPYLCRFVSQDPSGFAGGLNAFTYANGNPVSYLDPFGLGAVAESALSSSWMPTAPTAGEQQMQSFLTDFVNFATLGLANDAAVVGSGLFSGNGIGRDLYGNIATRQDQMVSAVMLGLAFIPGEDVEAAGSRVATELGEGVAQTVRFSSGAGGELGIGSQALLNDAVFGDAALKNVSLGTFPFYDASLQSFGRFTVSGLNNFGVTIGPQAFVNRTELIGTIVHEETHLRFFERLNSGGARTGAIDAAGMEEYYVRAVEARFLRMQGLLP
jgi:RHS repeat-associated protein